MQAGAKRVLVSAPADGADLTVVYGVNDDKLAKEHTVVSNASCTTNCLAPVVAVLHKAIGIEHGFMTTIHSYTGDQPTLDTLHKDLYRARAAALNIIPTSTGAAKAIGLVIPDLKGKLDGSSLRVPTPNVSLVDFKFRAKRATTVDEVNKAIKDASESNRLKGILDMDGRAARLLRPQPRPAAPRPSRSTRPRSSTATSFASSHGTTTSGASPTAWRIPRSRWESSANAFSARAALSADLLADAPALPRHRRCWPHVAEK